MGRKVKTFKGVSDRKCRLGGFCYVHEKGKKAWCSKCHDEFEELPRGKIKNKK